MDEIAERILNYEKEESLSVLRNMDLVYNLHDFETVKSKIVLKFISRELNREYLQDKCWMGYFDIVVCFQIEIGSDDRGIMAIATG